ncbi:ABC transporter ATP-binding protein [Rhodococcus zopfii]|uniref:ABC transporter ATP-binding protein n=1 Tax=Rhodococcus zopfii TaxID=43772 RepID=UPI00352813D9
MASISFRSVSHRYPGSDRLAVDRLDLDVADGEFLVVVGPSGCGKSTTLRMVAGLEAIDSGHIEIGGRDVTGMAPKDRDVAMVFQNYALYPNMTVAQNMSFALRNAGVGRDECSRRVADAARLLDLTEYLDRRPARLSGGQRQRVAMGRAIVREPAVFCMDEPLSNLDAKLRVQTRSQISTLQRRLGTTTVYVTHDQVEAMTMGDRVAVLDRGVLQQVATPEQLYNDPVNTMVAGFLGAPATNLITAPVVDGAARIGDLSIPVPPGRSGPRVTVGIRPEAFDLAADTEPGTLALAVGNVEYLGAESLLYLNVPKGSDWTTETGSVVVRVPGRIPATPWETVHVRLGGTRVLFFDPAGGQRVR